MHRQPLLEMLCRYERVFPRESDVVLRVRRLVESRANCFDRSCRPGHITAAAWIVSADRRRVLLTHHRKLGRWLQLGGHADGQWAVEQAALREAREESGMRHFDFVAIDGELIPFDIDVHQIPTLYDEAGDMREDAHQHHDIRFLMVARAEQTPCASAESYDVDWFTPAQVLNLTGEQSVLRMLRKGSELLD